MIMTHGIYINDYSKYYVNMHTKYKY